MNAHECDQWLRRGETAFEAPRRGRNSGALAFKGDDVLSPIADKLFPFRSKVLILLFVELLPLQYLSIENLKQMVIPTVNYASHRDGLTMYRLSHANHNAKRLEMRSNILLVFASICQLKEKYQEKGSSGAVPSSLSLAAESIHH